MTELRHIDHPGLPGRLALALTGEGFCVVRNSTRRYGAITRLAYGHSNPMDLIGFGQFLAESFQSGDQCAFDCPAQRPIFTAGHFIQALGNVRRGTRCNRARTGWTASRHGESLYLCITCLQLADLQQLTKWKRPLCHNFNVVYRASNLGHSLPAGTDCRVAEVGKRASANSVPAADRPDANAHL